MQNTQVIERVIDLTNPDKNLIHNMTSDEARRLLARGDHESVRGIDGQFALVAKNGITVYLARSIGRPLRYFLAKLVDGPCLIAAERIDVIYDYLKKEGLDHQFHPSYTRMVPAHYVTEIALVGCPDPNPVYRRFFSPQREALPADETEIGKAYIGALYDEVAKWLQRIPAQEPVGVCFSGGIDSGAVFLTTYHAMLQLGMNPARLKAFTLTIDGDGADYLQARQFMTALELDLFLEAVEVPRSVIDWREAVRVVEDYKPLDIQAATMGLALCRGIRERYPDWRYLIDGDGGDENLKDYPIAENPELTIRSVLNNRMLYQEGWGVEAIKHSLTYSGGLSRGAVRTYAPADRLGFAQFSPFTLPAVIGVAEGIPFIELTGWSEDRLYVLKGEVVRRGIRAVTGLEMPVFAKRRFQHGTAAADVTDQLFPDHEIEYRQAFQALYAG